MASRAGDSPQLRGSALVWSGPFTQVVLTPVACHTLVNLNLHKHILWNFTFCLTSLAWSFFVAWSIFNSDLKWLSFFSYSLRISLTLSALASWFFTLCKTWSLSTSVSLILCWSKASLSSYWDFSVWIFFWLSSNSSISFCLMLISVESSTRSSEMSSETKMCLVLYNKHMKSAQANYWFLSNYCTQKLSEKITSTVAL